MNLFQYVYLDIKQSYSRIELIHRHVVPALKEPTNLLYEMFRVIPVHQEQLQWVQGIHLLVIVVSGGKHTGKKSDYAKK